MAEAGKMAKRIVKKSKNNGVFIVNRLPAIISILHRVMLGDFTRRVKVSQKEDNFRKLLVTLNLIIESFQRVKKEKQEVEKEAKKHSLELDNIKQALLNITDDLNKEKIRLEKEKIKDEAILGSIGDGVVVTDNNRKIILMNKSARRILNSKSSVGKDFFKVWSMEDENGHEVPADKQPIQLALSSARITTTTVATTGAQYYCVRKDGTKFPIAVTVSPVILKGKTIGVVHVFRDVSKEKEIDKVKSEFVSIASHQLRTPLSITKWHLEAIKEEEYFKNAPKTSLAYLNEIYKSNERLISLVHSLLSVSRIDQRRIKNNPQETDIVQLIKDTIKEISPVAAKENIKFYLVVKPDDLQTMFIDPFQFHEVIETLLINAIEYNIPSGRVEITVDKKTDDILLISIKDTGIGLSQEDQKKLFTKFFRSKKAVSKNPDGSGLGLFIVKSYIEAWGGKVFVESQEGRGSTFIITIPLNKARKELIRLQSPEATVNTDRKGVAKN